MVIGNDPARAVPSELRAEIGVGEDYSKFHGLDKAGTESEREVASFDLHVDEESQNGLPHAYIPVDQVRQFEDDSIDRRTKTSVGTGTHSVDDYYEVEDDDESEEEKENEEEETFSETEYTGATSTMTQGTVTQKTVSVGPLSFDPQLIDTP